MRHRQMKRFNTRPGRVLDMSDLGSRGSERNIVVQICQRVGKPFVVIMNDNDELALHREMDLTKKRGDFAGRIER
jgi:hypothetical protein